MSLPCRNILVNSAGAAKIGDFGHARFQRPGTRIVERVNLALHEGAYRFLAPEILSERPYDLKVDVYAFGMVLFEMFEGAKTHSTKTAASDADSLFVQQLPYCTRALYPAGVAEVIQDCWCDDPSSRPSFQDIIRRLESVDLPSSRTSKRLMPASSGGSKLRTALTRGNSFTGSCTGSFSEEGSSGKGSRGRSGSSAEGLNAIVKQYNERIGSGKKKSSGCRVM
eukprot:jgi/Chlat1/5576/Chrsp369S05359